MKCLRWLKNNLKMNVTVNKETQEKRIKICKSCEFKSVKFLSIFNSDSCKICQCNIKAKTKMAKEFGGSCPIDKW